MNPPHNGGIPGSPPCVRTARLDFPEALEYHFYNVRIFVVAGTQQ